MGNKASSYFTNIVQLTLVFGLVSCGVSSKKVGMDAETTMGSGGEMRRKMKERPSPLAVEAERVGSALVSVEYSQPGVKGRNIWGDLVRFDKLWRTGANEANIFSTDKPILINGDTLSAGKYSLFTIPSREEWVVIFNKVYDQWGGYDYDRKEDAMRHIVRPHYVNELQERMDFDLDSNGQFTFSWEYLRFDLMIEPIND